MTHLLDGKALAAEIRSSLKSTLSHASKPVGLAVVLVGDNPASHVYVRNKEKACAEIGITSIGHRLAATTTEGELLDLILSLNRNPDVHGILVQLPLPAHISERRILEAIDPAKDVDGFHPVNMGRLLSGIDALKACTPLGCIKLIESSGETISGKHAVVIGRSNIVGKPVAVMLLERHATVTICHSRTRDLPAICRGADIVVAAIGKPHFVKGDWIKPGAIVIDVGINRLDDGRLVGDVDFEGANAHAGWITPVPGGVGPMTIAMLMHNVIQAAGIHPTTN